MGEPRVVVIGGGVIGAGVARELALDGADVTVCDDGSRPGAASWAAAGMLSPLTEAAHHPAFQALAEASLELYPGFVSGVEADSGQEVEYRSNGKLHVALDDTGEAELDRFAASPAAERFGIERISGDAARKLEPRLGPAVRGALHVTRDGRVDSRRLNEALQLAGRLRGVRFVDARVSGIETAGGRARGVRLADGRRADANVVVLAAGAWSGDLGGISPPPVRPVRGQMLAVLDDAPLFARTIASPRCYLIPRDDGRVLIGASVEEVGFESGTTVAALASLHEAAVEVAPRIAELSMVASWFGFRPGTPDGLPILGEDPELPGLIHATGHYRNGVLLTPITARIVASLARGWPAPIGMDPFGIARFRAPRTAASPAAVESAAAASPRCDLCDGVMFERHCRLICSSCGYQRDCSDP